MKFYRPISRAEKYTDVCWYYFFLVKGYWQEIKIIQKGYMMFAQDEQDERNISGGGRSQVDSLLTLLTLLSQQMRLPLRLLMFSVSQFCYFYSILKNIYNILLKTKKNKVHWRHFKGIKGTSIK